MKEVISGQTINPVKIGMILDRDFPPDDRPEKEALSLIEAGFDVYLLCYTSSGKPLREDYKGIHIVRFPLSEKIHKKFSAAYLALPVYRWIYTRMIRRFIIENDLNILHVHDLPMSDIAYRLSRKYKLKLVCDQHEYWSNWIGNTYRYNTPAGRIVKALSDWKTYEYVNLHRADLVITVSEPLRQLYIRNIALPEEKIITVPNTPTAKIFNEQHTDPEIIRKYADDFMLFYAGAIDILRGIDLVVQAIALLKKKIPAIRLVLAGRYARGCDIPQLATSLGVAENLEFLGWLNVEQLPSYMLASKVCIFTPPSSTSDEINNTIATKIYQYAAMRKPIIVSNARMMKEFVVQNGIGSALAVYSAEDLADTIYRMYKNYAEIAEEVKKNAAVLIASGQIFWDQTVKEMVGYYKNNLR